MNAPAIDPINTAPDDNHVRTIAIIGATGTVVLLALLLLTGGTDLYQGARDAGVPAHVISGDADHVTITAGGDGDQTTGQLIRFIDHMENDLGFTGAVRQRMSHTRALDGTQTATSPDGYVATWNYHPDSGMTIIVERGA